MLVLGSKSFEESYVVALRKVSKLNYVYPVCSYLGRVFKGTESSPPNAAKSVLRRPGRNHSVDPSNMRSRRTCCWAPLLRYPKEVRQARGNILGNHSDGFSPGPG
jgi:hypothetical protein